MKIWKWKLGLEVGSRWGEDCFSELRRYILRDNGITSTKTSNDMRERGG